MAEALFYQENSTGFFLRAEGHLTAAVSTELRDLVVSRFERAPVPALLVDLSACEYMDSTFMGLLVGFHKRCQALTGRPLTVLRPSAECVRLLAGLGVLRLLDVVTGPAPASPAQWIALPARAHPTAEILLHAHRDLSELSVENERKFAALRSVLEQQLENED